MEPKTFSGSQTSCTRSGAETLVIPWNMRDGMILGVGLGNPDWNFSAPHGTGRRMGAMRRSGN